MNIYFAAIFNQVAHTVTWATYSAAVVATVYGVLYCLRDFGVI